MKTLTKTLFATTFIAIILAFSAFTTFAAQGDHELIKASNALTFNKIKVSGNVKVILTQRDKESITINGEYNKDKTSIKRLGYTLIISSAEEEQVIITIAVKDLQRIEASNSVAVMTQGKLDLKYLQIFLKDKASANVKADAGSLFTMITGRSDLKLTGSCGSHTLIKNESSKLNMDSFASAATTITPIDSALAVYTVRSK